jgi:hypothetical protein
MRVPSPPRVLPAPRFLSLLRVFPAALGLLVLALVPAAQAAETLVLTCHICSQVVATGKGLPTNTQVRVTLNDVYTGQTLDSMMVQTDSAGAFTKTIPVDLFKHQSVESTVYKSNGSVLVVAAHNRFTAPCKDGKMLPMAGMHEMSGMEDHLAFTGSHTPQFLEVGFSLLTAGALLLLLAGRRERSRA